jgi:ABC-type amino acid transport substrate-binding protein
VLDGTSYVSFAQRLFPKAKLLEYPTWEEVVQAVLDRKALAAFRDEVEVRSIVLNRPELAFQLKSILVADSDDGKGIAVARENPLLKEVANLYIDNYARPVEADAVLAKISDALDTNTSQEKE